MGYIVIRRAPDLPEDFDIGDLEGKWFDMAKLSTPPLPTEEIPVPVDFDPAPEDTPVIRWAPWGDMIAVPTGRYERRADGEHAEVYEVRV